VKAVILAGGLGTRVSEETIIKPKPLIEIGEMPIIWHIMKNYSKHGINDFIICLGYKGYMIKEYFANYFLHTSDVTIDIKNNKTDIHDIHAEPWKITLIDTGKETMTGGRLKQIEKYIDNTFCLTYGDGLANVDITRLIEFHKKNNRVATVTAVQPPGRFGSLDISENKITNFEEKPIGDGGWINGGFFICEPKIFDYIENDKSVLEKETLEKLVKENQLSAYRHTGFWQSLDTLRDKKYLEDLWNKENPPWKVW
jgi:glucose-1-phosphate cytidylyltransferase